MRQHWQSISHPEYSVMAFEQGQGLYVCDWLWHGKATNDIGFSCSLLHLKNHYRRVG